MKNISIKQFFQLLIRYNIVIFIVLVSAVLIFAILILNGIIISPDTNTGSSTTATSFDRATINRLDKLETSANNTNYQNIASGRINPFSE